VTRSTDVFSSTALRWSRSKDPFLWILDQRLLPQSETWMPVRSTEDMVEAIQTLKVRGAPLIGVAAALSLAQTALRGTRADVLVQEASRLRAARPTAVNLMNALDRMVRFVRTNPDPEAIAGEALAIAWEDVDLCAKMAEIGASLISEGDGVLTHCNAGALATAGVGTALGVIARAHGLGRRIHVFVDETRPLLQGGRLTAWEMGKLNVPYTLIADVMAASVMAQGKIQKIFVGCDRVATNGDFANKIGTYAVAVLARHHGIPFYVVGPHTTIDSHCGSGKDIPIEQRDPQEVRGAQGAFGSVTWAPAQAPVYNPSFDVTPASLVTGWVMDTGLFDQDAVRNGALRMGHSSAAHPR
jgi:methylthioribose-1-phosphate isomerase